MSNDQPSVDLSLALLVEEMHFLALREVNDFESCEKV